MVNYRMVWFYHWSRRFKYWWVPSISSITVNYHEWLNHSDPWTHSSWTIFMVKLVNHRDWPAHEMMQIWDGYEPDIMAWWLIIELIRMYAVDEFFWSRFPSIYGHLNCLPIVFLSAIGSFQLWETYTMKKHVSRFLGHWNFEVSCFLGQLFMEELVLFWNVLGMSWRPHNRRFLVGDHGHGETMGKHAEAMKNHGKWWEMPSISKSSHRNP